MTLGTLGKCATNTANGVLPKKLAPELILVQNSQWDLFKFYKMLSNYHQNLCSCNCKHKYTSVFTRELHGRKTNTVFMSLGEGAYQC